MGRQFSIDKHYVVVHPDYPEQQEKRGARAAQVRQGNRDENNANFW